MCFLRISSQEGLDMAWTKMMDKHYTFLQTKLKYSPLEQLI